MSKQARRKPVTEYERGHIFGAISAITVAASRLRAGAEPEDALLQALSVVIQTGMDLGIPTKVLVDVTNDFAQQMGIGDLLSVEPIAMTKPN